PSSQWTVQFPCVNQDAPILLDLERCDTLVDAALSRFDSGQGRDQFAGRQADDWQARAKTEPSEGLFFKLLLCWQHDGLPVASYRLLNRRLRTDVMVRNAPVAVEVQVSTDHS